MHSICKIRKIISRKLLNNKYGNKILMRLSYDLDKIRQDPEDSNVSANSSWYVFSMLVEDIIVGYLYSTLIITINWQAGGLNDAYVL